MRDISDSDIPKISYFSRLTWSVAVAYEVIFTFASILLLAGLYLEEEEVKIDFGSNYCEFLGVSAERRYLLLPWLSVSFVTFMLGVILVLALMFSFANNVSVIIFLGSGEQYCIWDHFIRSKMSIDFNHAAPVVAAVVYLWITVYSTFHQMKTTETGSARCTTSSSFSSSLVRHSQATSASVQVKQQVET